MILSLILTFADGYISLKWRVQELSVDNIKKDTVILIIIAVFPGQFNCLFVKKISSNENLIYIIGLILLMVIFNITENILLKLGIVQYANLKL